MNHHYNPNLKKYARKLRSETVSRAEKYLWKALLSKNQTSVKFKRQRPILYYIVDFFCQELKLIIEIDGNSHVNKGEYDRKRQDHLESAGYTFLRFSEGDVVQNLNLVEEQIRHAIYCLRERDS